MNERLATTVLVLVGLAMLPADTRAEWIWDITSGDQAAITDGPGTWQDGAGNWNTGSGDTVWSNANPEVARFGSAVASSAYNVPIAGTVRAAGLTLYKRHKLGFDGTAGGGTIEFAGSSPLIQAYNQAYIYANCTTAANVDVVTFTGAGTNSTRYLFLHGANTFDAPVVFGSDDNGVLAMPSNEGALGGSNAAGIAVKPGTTLSLRSEHFTTAKPFTIAGDGYGGRGALQFYTSYSGRVMSGPVSLAANATVKLSGENTIAGALSGNETLAFRNAYTNAPGIIHLANDANATKSLVVAGDNGTAAPVTIVLDADYAAAESVEIGVDGAVILAADAVLNSPTTGIANRGVLSGVGSVAGNVVGAAGSRVSPGQAIGTLAITGDVTIGGTLDVQFDSAADVIDRLDVAGQLDLTGATIHFSDLGSETLGGGPHVLATYGTLTGCPAIETGVPEGWSIDYRFGGHSIALVPEPAVLALLWGMVLAWAVRRNRSTRWQTGIGTPGRECCVQCRPLIVKTWLL